MSTPSISPDTELSPLLVCASTNNALPVEIQAQIFYQVHIEATSGNHAPFISSKTHPSNVLTQVCKDWRLIAYSMPELWSYLKIAIPWSSRLSILGPDGETQTQSDLARLVGKMQALQERVISWLGRSKAQPLRVNLFDAHRDAELHPASYIAAFDSLWSILSATSSRWVGFEIKYLDGTGRWLLHVLQPGDQDPGRASPLSLSFPNITSLGFHGGEEEFSSLASHRWMTVLSLAEESRPCFFKTFAIR